MFFFFFSSRRRHTRWTGDWSSDVCSSDLRGVRSLVVVTSGLEVAARADLLAVCRRHGMRLVGPDCFGVAVPGIGLNAPFAPSAPRTGVAGLVMQSVGLGLA